VLVSNLRGNSRQLLVIGEDHLDHGYRVMRGKITHARLVVPAEEPATDRYRNHDHQARASRDHV
jgi:hypothetical protein